jgi:PBS lyase HEAT-like repeat
MMEKDKDTRYQPPVERLLTYGKSEPITPDDWPDYRTLGIGPEHIPELIQMATDADLNLAAEDSTQVWAPLHAWRALGQLRAVEAVEPLLELFDRLEDDDWVHDELPVVFALIGPAALPALAAYLADLSHTDTSRISATGSIEQIAKRWPDSRDEAIAILEERLERFEENESDVNAFLVYSLVKLGAKEAAPLIERAFAEGYVDPLVMGDWDDVQVELGLKSAEEVASRQRSDWGESPLPTPVAQEPFTPASSQLTHKQKAAQKKAKSKMAKLSRKKNRKR